MSLKAKIEAVIYASEEPVTLAQLIGVLGEEAQAELDAAAEAAAAEQQTLRMQAATASMTESAMLNPTLGMNLSAAEALAEAMESFQPTEPAPATSEASPSEAAADGAAARAERARLARLRGHFRQALDELVAEYAQGDRGLEIREVAGGFRFATKPEYHDAVRGFVRSLKPPLKLTLQALETLAVVAYKQPVTAPEIAEIRGVDSGGVLGSLMTRKLITTAGRKQVIGRPILYKTTKDFLLKFGLKDVGELPSIEEFEKLAGQMAEQEDLPMPDDVPPEHHAPEPPEALQPEREAYSPQADGLSAAADNVSAEDKASVDGRLSSLPPNYDDASDDPSAKEAEIQQAESQEAESQEA